MSRRLLAILSASIVALSALAAVTHGQSGEYKIGVLEPLTGPLAGEGKRHLEGYEVVRDMINEAKPATLKTCVLLRKPTPGARETPIDYLGFEIPEEFVVGYGLDYAERYRNLPFVGVLKPEVYTRTP